ncbi:PP2C family protein-serine/threonine phosphatase [Lignipirellula cremea]|uniref:Phosphoserine phosphatase RsbU n=1 Tax=Lignipirellula cremea TaxID=2528010 RepID=A0A518DN60_9BACT|nr:PP2C family protein-serine/threonine phosphatase [Lignipirellula cremea]QDU93270.1 Phosphoserine phosphatase RsbU [Lignipirellula cremea]
MSISDTQLPVGSEEHDKVTELLRLMEISQQLAATVDLQELLALIEQAARELLRCDRATVFVYDAPTHELYSYVQARSEQIRFPADRGLAGACFLTGQLTHTPDAYADDRFNRAVDASTGYRTRNILTCPLTTVDRTVVGVLQSLNKHEGGFTEWDQTLMQTLSAQCGVALQRQFLLQEFAQKQRLERELTLARDIQQGLLPGMAPQAEGYDIAGWNQPADQTGGDFYHFQTLPDGRLCLVVADVTGHGIAAALLASQCYALYRAAMFASTDVGETATQVNGLLSEDIPLDRFVTAFFTLLDPATGEFVYAAAGHGPVYLIRFQGDNVELEAQGPPLGVIGGLAYKASDPIRLEQGDILFLCTDGFFEWENRQQEAYGVERLCAAIARLADRPASEIISSIYRELLEHADGAEQSDDLTAVVVKKL